MRFNWTTLWVKDMEKSLEFYQQVVGLSLLQRYLARPGMEIAFLGAGETQVELICDKNKATVTASPDISLGFESGPLEQLIKFLSGRNISVHSGPFAPNPHIRYLFVTDPDGWMIQFVEHPSFENGSTPHKE